MRNLSLAPASVAALFAVIIACSSANSAGTCLTLATCCAGVPIADQASCQVVADSEDAASCSEGLTAYQPLCPSSPGGSGATGCSALAACCAMMTGVNAQVCTMVAAGGSATACSSELSSYQMAGQCVSPIGTGPGGATGCASLATCCAAMTGTSAAACSQIVTAGVSSSCTAELSVLESTGACSAVGTGPGGTGPGGTGPGGTGPGGTGPGGSGPGGSGPGSTGSGSGPGHPGTGTGTGHGGGGDSGPVGCAPQALPVGFTATAKPSLGVTSCNATTLDALISGCFADASTSATCMTPEESSCGMCVLSSSTGPNWGPVVQVVPTGAAANYAISLINLGGCIASVDPTTTGTICGADLEKLEQCELASCIPSCPVIDNNDVAGNNALFGDGTDANPGCLNDAAADVVCMSYTTAVNTDCAPEFTEAGTGPGDRCAAFIDSSSTTLPDLIGVYCGGADAGL